MEKDGFRETLLEMYSHTGTHMDAPAHMLPKGRTLDDFPRRPSPGGASCWIAGERRRSRCLCCGGQEEAPAGDGVSAVLHRVGPILGPAPVL